MSEAASRENTVLDIDFITLVVRSDFSGYLIIFGLHHVLAFVLLSLSQGHRDPARFLPVKCCILLGCMLL